MKKLSRVLVAIAIVAAAFLTINSNDTTSDVLSLEIASALETSLVAGNPNCTNDEDDTCKVYGTSISDCDEATFSNNCKADKNEDVAVFN